MLIPLAAPKRCLQHWLALPLHPRGTGLILIRDWIFWGSFRSERFASFTYCRREIISNLKVQSCTILSPSLHLLRSPSTPPPIPWLPGLTTRASPQAFGCSSALSPARRRAAEGHHGSSRQRAGATLTAPPQQAAQLQVPIGCRF